MMFIEDSPNTSGPIENSNRSDYNRNFNEVVHLAGKKTKKKPHWIAQLFMNISLMLLCGTTIMFLWNWYISSLGIATINLFHALGIDMLLTFIVTRDAEGGSAGMDVEKWLANMVFAALTLLLGFVFHFFI